MHPCFFCASSLHVAHRLTLPCRAPPPQDAIKPAAAASAAAAAPAPAAAAPADAGAAPAAAPAAKPLSALTEAERLALRAEKFKTTAVQDSAKEKLLARAARFGVACPELEAAKAEERKKRFGIVTDAEKKAAEAKEAAER